MLHDYVQAPESLRPDNAPPLYICQDLLYDFTPLHKVVGEAVSQTQISYFDRNDLDNQFQ